MEYRFNYSTDKDITRKKTYGASLTVPDQSMGIKELIARHQRGLPLTGKQPVYNVHESAMDDDAFQIAVNKMQHLDLAEREEIRDRLDYQIRTLKGKAEEEVKLAAEQKKKAAEAAELKKYEELRQRFEKTKPEGQKGQTMDLP